MTPLAPCTNEQIAAIKAAAHDRVQYILSVAEMLEQHPTLKACAAAASLLRELVNTELGKMR